MALTALQLEQRDGKLTASRVGCLMGGDPAKVIRLWQEMVGDPDFTPDDYSGVWPVQLGVATEALNLAWYERKTGRPLSRQGEVVVHPEADWAAATLDAWDDAIPAPVEAKHVGGWEPLSKIIERYQPQLHWQMMVTNADQAVLSVIEGAREPVVETIPFDAEYAAELWRRAETFISWVWNLTPPVAMAPVAPPVPPEKWRSFNLDDLNEIAGAWPNWAYAMQAEIPSWLATASAAKSNARAAKAIKELLPDDVGLVTGEGVKITRSKNGAVTIKEAK